MLNIIFKNVWSGLKKTFVESVRSTYCVLIGALYFEK